MESFRNILFIDIETVPVVPDYDLLPEGMQLQWDRKSRTLKGKTDENLVPAVLFGERAGIFSEFAKVVCIGIGCISGKGEEARIILKALADEDEKTLLNKFCEALTRFLDRFPDLRFCGHNIREFDIPFLCRRMIINGMDLPDCMQLNGKKPWEINHIDTLELWRFGDFKNYTTLALLAEVLGIPSPKDDIDGSMVADIFWKEKDLARISRYCLKDVYTTAKVFLRLKGVKDMAPEPQYVNE
jgi:hypothetical protein